MRLSIPLILLPLTLLLPACLMSKLRSHNPQAIGAVAESSARLSKIITQEVPDKNHGPKNILEIGAGTGVFTQKLIEKLGPYDRLDIVELTPELCEILDQKFSSMPRVTLFCGDILAWKPHYRYDYIVSGLPFNSFEASLVEKITAHIVSLSHEETLMSFFEYKWIPTLRLSSLKGEALDQYKKTRVAIDLFIKDNEIYNDSVYINIPPAIAHFLKIKGARRKCAGNP